MMTREECIQRAARVLASEALRIWREDAEAADRAAERAA